MTVGNQPEPHSNNPACVDTIDINQIVDNYIIVECPTVMRGGYVTFIRNLGGQDIHAATLCEVAVMGRRIISMY